MREVQADAVVIGAGAGGLCAAARLVHQGLRPIVVEAHDKVVDVGKGGWGLLLGQMTKQAAPAQQAPTSNSISTRT